MFDEKYLERYAAVILNIPHIDAFCDSLPSNLLDGYEVTMNKILSAIEREKEGYNELISQTTDPKDIKFIKKEVELLTKKEAIVRNALEKSNDQADEKEASEENPNKKHLIFLKSQAGNVLVEGDIKSFPGESLLDIVEMFNRLKDYNFGFNSALHKKLNNNGTLTGIFEVKLNFSRIIYKHLDKDTVLIIRAFYKNQTNPDKEREVLVARIKQTQGFVNSLLEDLKNPEKKSKLIEDNSVIEANLVEQINSMSRGQKL